MVARRFFGTDGIRGPVGSTPMTLSGVVQLGQALGSCLSEQGRPRVLIGMDTRESGAMFAHATATGLLASGVDVQWGGVLPTPAIAYLTRRMGCAAGVVISASHNPYTDNGLKYFGADGYKLPDHLETHELPTGNEAWP
ncbi:phosphoglucosamine mutase, partial [bacterium]|nr:phosphoglucosamine mutase [bacterium]